jgi:hypothetical protein
MKLSVVSERISFNKASKAQDLSTIARHSTIHFHPDDIFKL